MEEPKLKVKVTAYESSLIIETQEFEKDGNFIPCGNGNLGCVVIDTEKFLGMSKEAYALICNLKQGRDDLGDILIYKDSKGNGVFSWLGGFYQILSKCNIQLSNSCTPLDVSFIEIPNIHPEGAMKYIKENSRLEDD